MADDSDNHGDSSDNHGDSSDNHEDERDHSIAEFTRLVNQNGLVKLFANRTRARILVTLFYSEQPLTTDEIASGADIYRTATVEAIEAMEPFGIVIALHDGDETRYRLDEDDELVETLRAVAELTTERFYGGERD